MERNVATKLPLSSSKEYEDLLDVPDWHAKVDIEAAVDDDDWLSF